MKQRAERIILCDKESFAPGRGRVLSPHVVWSLAWEEETEAELGMRVERREVLVP